MKVRFGGNLSRRTLHLFLDKVFELYGEELNHLQEVNLTFTPFDKKGYQLTLMSDKGEPIEGKDMTPRRLVVQTKAIKKPVTENRPKGRPKLVSITGGRQDHQESPDEQLQKVVA